MPRPESKDPMDKNDPAVPSVYIREWRKARGLTVERLAALIGRDKSVVSKMERGKSGLTTSTLDRVAEALGIHTAALYQPPPEGTGPVAAGAGNVGRVHVGSRRRFRLPDSVAEGRRGEMVPGVLGDARPADDVPAAALHPRALARDLPVLGTAAGSKKGAMQLLPESPVDWVRRPPALEGVPGAYAFYVVGDSMDPAHPDGALRFAHPHRPVHVGDAVLVQVQNGEDEPIETYLKYLERRTAKVLFLRQLNPRGTIELPTGTIKAVHKVPDMNELFGV